MIVDEDGQLVWFRPAPGEERDIMDFKVQRYKGEPVLTWWEGLHTSYGQGEYVIADRSYRELTRVRAMAIEEITTSSSSAIRIPRCSTSMAWHSWTCRRLGDQGTPRC
jgi:hypothetical protein